MNAQQRINARKHLDKRLNSARDLEALIRPSKGWIKAIREALGMTTAQLAQRIGVSQSRAVEIEKAEINSSITLSSLQRAAQALNCELKYCLVPRNSLQTMVEDQATKIARQRMQSIGHTMILENQEVDQSDLQDQLRMLAQQIADKSTSELWRNE